MAVNIYEWSRQITLSELGSALNSRVGKSRLANRITSPLNQLPQPAIAPTPRDLQAYIDLYGEQVTQDAVGDLRRYFQIAQTRGFTSGGLSTQLPPLSIGPGDVRPSVTAISVIGEGLAGWYMERRSLRPLARPVGEGVDLIFQSAASNSRKYALIQVKATQQENIVSQMKRAVPGLLQYTYNVAAIAPNAYSCYIIGIIIRQRDEYDIMSLEISIV